MKLLFCDYCGDIFNLNLTLKQCSCGRVKGYYLPDGNGAVVNGKGRSLAIGNGSFHNALQGKAQFEYTNTHRTTGKPLTLCTFLAWVRPNTGGSNPNTYIDETL